MRSLQRQAFEGWAPAPMPIHDTFFPLVSFVIYVLLYIVYLQGEGVRQRRRRERPDAGYGLRYLVARLRLKNHVQFNWTLSH